MRLPRLLPCLWVCALILTAHGDEVATPNPGPASSPSPSPIESTTTHLIFELSDGSRVVGTPSIDKLRVTTVYASLDIALALIHSITFPSDSNRTAHLDLNNGDQLNANISATQISMKTAFGPVVIPMFLVRTIEVSVISDAPAAMPEGLVLRYTFEKSEEGKVADTSGSGNDGTIHNATWIREGRKEGAMKFNGDGQAIIIKNSPSLQLKDFTIMFWIKRGDAISMESDENMLIFGYGMGGYNVGLNGDGRLFLGTTGSNAYFTSNKIPETNFHHVAVTKKGNKVVVYIDGLSYPAPGDNDFHFEYNTDLAVGAMPGNLSAAFRGLLDNLEVFNRALSDDEVKGVYDSQK